MLHDPRRSPPAGADGEHLSEVQLVLTRSLTSAAAATALLVVLAAGAAVADTADATGPDSAACATATTQVLIRSAQVVHATDQLTAAHKAELDTLGKTVDAAQKTFDQAVQAAAGGDATAAEVKALTDAQTALDAAVSALHSAAADLPETTVLTAAKTALDEALGARDKACAAPPAVAARDCQDFASRADAQAALDRDPTLQPTLDPDRDGLACSVAVSLRPTQAPQVPVVPVGPVQTGA